MALGVALGLAPGMALVTALDVALDQDRGLERNDLGSRMGRSRSHLHHPPLPRSHRCPGHFPTPGPSHHRRWSHISGHSNLLHELDQL